MEESKFKKVKFNFEEEEQQQQEEEKNVENSAIKFRSFSEKGKNNYNRTSPNKTNRTNRSNKTEDNSLLNLVENNSFVKMNKKNLHLQSHDTKKELILPINNKQNYIKKDLIFNENQLILNYQKINELEEGK